MALDLDPTDISAMIAAVGALGTAAFALVDATKAYRGGVSNIGYRFIEDAVAPYEVALRLVDTHDPYATIHANWINGIPKADQKATVKALIRLGLTPATAPLLAAASQSVDGATLQTAATKVANGDALTDQELGVLGRFDATIDARLDAGFERAEQQYRYSSRVIAGVFAIILALLGGWIISEKSASAFFSFASHSLGARVVLEAAENLDRKARSVCVTAGAVDDNCLAGEYATAFSNAEVVSVLASRKDRVLQLAYPVGDPIADFLNLHQSPFRAALGRKGPPEPMGATVPPWQIPDACNYDHGNYLPPSGQNAVFPDPNGKWVKISGFIREAFEGRPATWPTT